MAEFLKNKLNVTGHFFFKLTYIVNIQRSYIFNTFARHELLVNKGEGWTGGGSEGREGWAVAGGSFLLSRSGGAAEPAPIDLQLTEKEHFAQKCCDFGWLNDLKNIFCQLLIWNFCIISIVLHTVLLHHHFLSISPPVFPSLPFYLPHWSYLFPLFSPPSAPSPPHFSSLSLRHHPSPQPPLHPLRFPLHSTVPSPPEVSSILRKESHVQLLNQANKTLLSFKQSIHQSASFLCVLR